MLEFDIIIFFFFVFQCVSLFVTKFGEGDCSISPTSLLCMASLKTLQYVVTYKRIFLGTYPNLATGQGIGYALRRLFVSAKKQY